ncbi:MAG: hypothetical protein MUO63_04910, partial [Desulfobulbaceae bacterium]|nr:hypothetical protein [Desulfobulbaceae bacterium]
MGRFCIASLFLLAATFISCLSTAISAESVYASPGRELSKTDDGSAIFSAPIETIANPHDMACNKCHIQGKDGKPEKGLLSGTD